MRDRNIEGNRHADAGGQVPGKPPGEKEIRMKYRIEGRSTGQGAHTTMGTPHLNVSRTGNHWEECLDLPVGGRFWIKDISGTGKHRCRWMRMATDDGINTIAMAIDAPHGYEDYWPGGECPVCNSVDPAI